MFRPLKGEVAEQQRFLEDIMVQGFDGMAVSPINPDAMTPLLDRVAAKMPVIVPRLRRAQVEAQGRTSARTTSRPASRRAAGDRRAEGRWATSARARSRCSSVASTCRTPSSAAGHRGDAGQGAGPRDPAGVPGRHRPRQAKKNVEDALARYPDLVLAIGIWSYNGPSLAGAVRASSRKDKPVIVAFDEDEETLKAVEDGLIYATIVQKPFEFGYQSMKVLKEHQGRQARCRPTSKPGITTVDQGKPGRSSGPSCELKK